MRELMRCRIDAHYRYDAAGRMLHINQWHDGRAPRFHLCRTPEGHLWRFRHDVPEAVTQALDELCRREPAGATLTPMPRLADEFLQVLETDEAPRIHAGPVYLLPPLSAGPAAATALDAASADLLRPLLPDWVPDLPYRHPFVAVVRDGRAVAVCASVRITPGAHEAGVETSPEYRRRGHAVRAVAAWAGAVRGLGATPFYSTTWDNEASQRVAARLAATYLGTDFHVA